MFYKIRYRPSYAVLQITLKPNEKIFVSLGTLIHMDKGLELERVFGGGWGGALLRYCLGKEDLMLNAISNSTNKPLKLTLNQTFPGDVTRLNLSKSGVVVRPAAYLAHTTGVTMGCHWLGFSSWLAGDGLVGLKLFGRGRVFLASYGSLVQSAGSKRFIIEHPNLLAYSPKIRLYVNFPKSVLGDQVTNTGTLTSLTGSGTIHWQSRCLSSLGRFLRLKLS